MAPLQCTMALLALFALAATTGAYEVELSDDMQTAALGNTLDGCDGGKIGQACEKCRDGSDPLAIGLIEASGSRGRHLLGLGPKPDCKDAVCTFGIRQQCVFDDDCGPDDAETPEFASGFFCRNNPAQATACFDILPEKQEPNCKTLLDNPAIAFAGYGCETFLMTMVDQVKGYYPDIEKEVDKTFEENPELKTFLEQFRFMDLCAKACDACDEPMGVGFALEDDDKTDDELLALLTQIRGEICVAYGYVKPTASASATVFGVEADFANCPFSNEAVVVADDRRRLGAASIDISGPLPAVNKLSLDVDNEDSAVMSGGESMGSKVTGGVMGFEISVERAGNEGTGVGIVGLIVLFVLAVLCLVCCPLCCCIYCCCCKKKQQPDASA